ncbi:MAG: NAD(P)/FAD-dependent oxidoreductase [Oscillospiraceae bacterium]|nr:NAD(P)/FAD-dependent oxidoreductase [Oscillospiraceae bacterium]
MRYDVAIIGAGVIGAMAARELSRYDLKICLLEKENDVAMGASRANSGIIHGGYDPIPGTMKAKMNTAGVPLLYEAAKELNVHYQNNGSFVCAFGAEENPAIDALYQRGLENGIEKLQILSGDEARAMEPNLSEKVTRVLYIPTAGIICPYDLTIAAAGNAMDNGVELLRNFEVSSIEAGFKVVSADGRTVACDYLLNCAGGYSDKVARMVGDDFFTIIPRAGEYMLLDKSEGSRVKHTIFQVPSKEGKGILVSPTVDGNLLTGPTALKVETPESVETTPEGLSMVSRLAAKSVPSVNFRQVITSFSGVRSSAHGDDFIIRPSAANPKCVHTGAIDSPGLTSCVAIAKYAVELLEKQGLALNKKENWNGHRENTRAFREMTDGEKDAFIKANPDYGRIVCRCEQVSEGEIRAAIRRNPKAFDIDSVKRRTRSGMGRCQGGFCSPYVMRLIAEEQGMQMEDVTKSGPGSAPLAGKL